MRHFRMFMLNLVVLFFSSCLDLTQEIWLNADGTGRVQLDIAFDPAKFIGESHRNGKKQTGKDMLNELKKEKGDLAKLPGVSKVSFSQFDAEDKKHLVMDVSFDDFNQIFILQDQLGLSDSEGSQKKLMTLKKRKKNSYDFSYVLEGQVKSKQENAQQQELAKSFLADSGITTILHAPKILKTNGEKIDAQTTQWHIAFADAFGFSKTKKWKAKISLAP